MHPREQSLTTCLTGRVCLVGVGKDNLGDDSLGLRLAEALAPAPASRRPGLVILRAGADPERHLRFLATSGFDHIVFMDAVDCGKPPGTVTLLAAEEIKVRFPLLSTHKIPLGVLAEYLEAEGGARVWLLGVQPAAIRFGRNLSASVQTTLEALADLMSDILNPLSPTRHVNA
jgi:hydrogenase 3 maturation protease